MGSSGTAWPRCFVTLLPPLYPSVGSVGPVPRGGMQPSARCRHGMPPAAPSTVCDAHVCQPRGGGDTPQPPAGDPTITKQEGGKLQGLWGRSSAACPCPHSRRRGAGQGEGAKWKQGSGEGAACITSKVKICIAVGAGRDTGSRGPYKGLFHAGTGTQRVPWVLAPFAAPRCHGSGHLVGLR